MAGLDNNDLMIFAIAKTKVFNRLETSTRDKILGKKKLL
jgi:hypothetical protein